MILQSPRPSFLFILLVAVACGEPQPVSSATWTLSEELRIGNESSPDYALTDVRGIAVSQDGRMFVLQPNDGAVRVFDADGTFVTSIGRSGDGPGEFTRIVSFGLQGDTLWVSDERGVHRFESTGRFLGTEIVRYQPADTYERPNGPDQIFADGSLAVMPGFIPTLDRSAWPEDIRLHHVQADTLLGELAAFRLDAITLFTAPDGRPRIAFRPFHPLAVYSYALDRSSLVAVSQQVATDAAQAAFRVSRIRFNGDTIFSSDVTYTPLAVPSAIRDSIENSVPAALAAERFKAAPIPEFYPPVQAVTIASNETIWADLQGHRPSRWLILDESGASIATATSKDVLRVFVVRGDQLWGVVKDELDVPYVIRARIVREPS